MGLDLGAHTFKGLIFKTKGAAALLKDRHHQWHLKSVNGAASGVFGAHGPGGRSWNQCCVCEQGNQSESE